MAVGANPNRPHPADQILTRARQPVIALANALARNIGAEMRTDVLAKSSGGPKLKDLPTKQDKLDALQGRLQINDSIQGDGPLNALLLDDLFDTGASAEPRPPAPPCEPVGKSDASTLPP